VGSLVAVLGRPTGSGRWLASLYPRLEQAIPPAPSPFASAFVSIRPRKGLWAYGLGGR
jgi:hypothetical protein